MADSQRGRNIHFTGKRASKQTLWSWLFVAALFLGSAGLITACAPEIGNASLQSQELSSAGELATSTILPPATIVEEISSLSQDPGKAQPALCLQPLSRPLHRSRQHRRRISQRESLLHQLPWTQKHLSLQPQQRQRQSHRPCQRQLMFIAGRLKFLY